MTRFGKQKLYTVYSIRNTNKILTHQRITWIEDYIQYFHIVRVLLDVNPWLYSVFHSIMRDNDITKWTRTPHAREVDYQ